MIYLTSDLHFCHNREFLYGPRGFSTVEEMNEAIIENWNNIINPEDDVYVLGDLMLNNNERGIYLIKQLKGNLHVILGNHDTGDRVKLYNKCYNICEIEYATRMRYAGYHLFLSHYPCLTSNFDYEKPLKTRCISLCGHTHTQDKFVDWKFGPIYHVDLDAHNCTPVALDQIIKDLTQKSKEN